MQAKQVFLTEEGLKKLEQELEELRTTKRREVVETIKVALSFGDLSENSEYDEAKNEQARVEMRISELEEMLKNVKIINRNEAGKNETVGIGSRVRVHDADIGEEMTYNIVGSIEADPFKNKISDESPVGRALLGKKQGEEANVEVPGGAYKLTILAINE